MALEAIATKLDRGIEKLGRRALVGSHSCGHPGRDQNGCDTRPDLLYLLAASETPLAGHEPVCLQILHAGLERLDRAADVLIGVDC